MHPKNTYFYVKSAISPEDCNKIISLGKSYFEEKKKLGFTTEGGTKGEQDKRYFDKIGKKVLPTNDLTAQEIKEKNLDLIKDTYIRDSEVAWLNNKWIYDLVMPFVAKANNLAGWKYDYENTEAFQFTKYGLNQFYGWHNDGQGDHNDVFKRGIPGVTPVNNFDEPEMPYNNNKDFVGLTRKLSVTINLSDPDDYDGGLLKFDYGPHALKERYHECVEIKPKGSIIIFPSYIYHQVTPVTRGTRYSLVLWVLGKPFR